ncbi:MAG: hypothetical protein R3A11_04890 [Bdellovibrionota bacterium]
MIGNSSTPGAQITPSNQSDDIPVNVIIKVHYPPELNVDEDKVNRNTQKVFVCPEKEETSSQINWNVAGSSTESTQPRTDQKKSTDKEEPATSPTTSTESTPLQTTFRKISNKEDGSLDVFLLATNPLGDSPFQAGEKYCVETFEMKNKDGQTIGGKTVQFTTTSSPNLVFDEEAMVSILNERDDESGRYKVYMESEEQKIVPGNLGLDFGDRAIHPDHLLKSLTLCVHQNLDETQIVRRDDTCEGVGYTIPVALRLYSSMQVRDSGIITTDYSAFAVTSSRLESGKTYTLFLDGSKISNNNLSSQKFSFDVVDHDETRQGSQRQMFHHLSDSNPEKHSDESQADQSLLFHVGMHGG